jgi:hypothetical protein
MNDQRPTALPRQREPEHDTTARTATCRCGHDATLHEHFRGGSDCASCDCARFHRTSLASALITALARPGR